MFSGESQSTKRPQSPGGSNFIDPATLMRIKSLELRAKMVVEGFVSGLNKSPYHGFSVEFTEYREYTPGDDLRYLDWRLYGRSDRYYVKRFEDETNLRCTLILDMSRSMGFGSLPYTKIDYTRTLAATLAYFLCLQRDAVGLVTFDERLLDYVPARFRTGQLRRLLLAMKRPVGGSATDLAGPLEQVAQRVKKRGMLILLSDLLAPLERLERHLGYLCARGHEVLVFQLLDPAEIEFNYQQPALFWDAESGREIYVDPQSARETYHQQLSQHLGRVQQTCDRLGITYRQLTTETPLERALAEFLRSRQSVGRLTRQQGRAGKGTNRSGAGRAS